MLVVVGSLSHSVSVSEFFLINAFSCEVGFATRQGRHRYFRSALSDTSFRKMVRKLKFHEQKLLKKVDFIDWKDNNLNENKVMARYALKKREEYTYYNKLSRQVRELARKLRDMPDRNPNKTVFVRQLLGKLYETGLIPTADTLERADKLTASSLCRRRLPTMMKKVGMMKSIRQAARVVEEGHVRVGQELVTDPAFLVSRDMSDFITWAPGSKVRKHVQQYNNTFDDFEEA